MSRIVSLVILLVIVVAVGIVCYQVMSGFILPLFLAALTVVIFRPVYQWLVHKCNGHTRLAAGLTTAAVMLVVLVPIGIAIAVAVGEGFQYLDDGFGVDRFLHAVRTRANLQLPFSAVVEPAATNDEGSSDTPPNVAPNPLNLVHNAIERLPSDVRWEEIDNSERHGDFHLALAGRVDELVHPIEELNLAFETYRVRLQDFEDVEDNELESDLKAARKAEPWLNKLNKQLENATSLLKRSENVSEETTTGNETELRDTLLSLDTSYHQFRRELLGGIPWCWAVELVNPNEKQQLQWQVKATDWLRGSILPITGQTAAILGNVIGFGFGLTIMLISIYYFLVDGPKMVQAMMRLSPLDDRHELRLLAEFDTVSRAVVMATLLSAVAQGLLAGIGYVVCGFQAIFLLTILTTFLALVPFVGAAAVWVPAALWLALVQDEKTYGIGFAVYGFLVISMADNIIKPLILHGQSNMHPLMALLSVLGGVGALGPIGILVGPMVVAFLQALLNMLQIELRRMDASPSLAGNNSLALATSDAGSSAPQSTTEAAPTSEAATTIEETPAESTIASKHKKRPEKGVRKSKASKRRK